MAARRPDAPAAGPSEEECLTAVMRLRFGDAPCRACGAADWTREVRRRAFSCRACGLKVFPCQDTPFAKPQPPLATWFRAIGLAARGLGGARPLHRLGLPRAEARALARAVARLRAEPEGPVRWFDEVAAFVGDGSRPAAVRTAPPETETLWQSVRALLAVPEFRGRPLFLGLGIGGVMLIGLGVGWLLVPAEPEADAELAQATAVLALGEERPVLLVTADVAAQLYDVSDDEAAPNSPLAPTIRVAPRLDGGRAGPPAGTPMAAPAIRLSASAGQSLVQGDTGALRDRARDKPELTAYTALATELEGRGTRNPDELLIFGPMRIRRYLVDKIVRASRVTQVDPVLLMAIADKESSFRTEAQAQTSSASGLYQFIEKTWLGVVREFGPRYGLASEAALVAAGEVSGPARTRILDLRRDPYLAAVLAAEMLKRDSLRIQGRIGRPLTGGEVYLVHFLGPDGAERMIDQIARKPDSVAAELLPRPAAANKPIFYGTGAGGEAKSLSVSEVRGKFETMISMRLDRYRAVKTVTPSGD